MKIGRLATLAAACAAMSACSQPFEATPHTRIVTEPVDDFGRVKARCEQSRVGAPRARRLTRSEFDNTIADVFPEIFAQWSGTDLPPDTNSALGFSNDARILTLHEDGLAKIAAAAEDAARRVTDVSHLGQVLPCAAANPGPDCAREFIVRYGARLFRRPLAQDEIDRYASFQSSVAARSDFANGLRWTLTALIQSPHTLYRTELGAPTPNGNTAGQDVELTPYELASELSYDFSGSPPSPELVLQAERGELDVPSRRVAIAAALLRSSRGQKMLDDFFRQWLGYGDVADKVRADHATFDRVKALMVEETRRFIDEVVVARQGGVRELLTAPFTVVSGPLLRFYGFDGPAGDDYQVVKRPSSGVGLLAQGSILAGNANSQGSSPTRRGLLVLERFLCYARPVAPPNVPSLQESAPAQNARTTRERYERLHAQSSFCRSCHAQFDPIGFGFEHFDEVGRYREDEKGNPIDAHGHFSAGDVGAGSADVAFEGLVDLAGKLAASSEVSACVSGLLAAYVYGEALVCPAESVRDKLVSHQIGLEAMIAEFAGTEHFARRRVP